MFLKSGFKRVACGGILLSCAFLSHGSGVAAEANATRALSARQRNLAFNQSQSDENATVAPRQVDDGDDDDDERALALFESVSKASTNAMKGIKSNAMVQKVFSKDPKLARTKSSFDEYKLQLSDPDNFFTQANFQPWFEKTIQRYKSDETKAYAAMYSTVLSRSKGDEEAVARLISSRSNLHAFHWFDAQINSWKARNLDTEEVFDLLKLSNEGPDLLNSPKLSSWVRFAGTKNEDPAERLWKYLTTRGVLKGKSDDKTPREAYSTAELGRLLQTPRETLSAVRLGPSLEKMLLVRWKQQKYPIGRALQDVGIRPPNLEVWLAYVRTLDYDNSYAIFATAGKFEVIAIAGAIGLALRSKNNLMAEAGKNMQIAQNKEWLNIDGKGLFKTYDQLFQDLKLNDAGKNLFASPLWTVWINYLKFADKASAKNTMMTILKAHFNEEELLGIAEEAEKVDSTKSIASFVKKHYFGEYRYPVSAQNVPKSSA
uniref:Putative RxLR effector n=1 Tax=Plasmopara viticola TaxID=143451 RepID=A0A650F594_PLAVT|nr:putative RxLR effector [Plasmopara viticola]